MAGFAYEIKDTESNRIARRDLYDMAQACSMLAEEIGLYINGQEGRYLFNQLAKALEKHAKEG